MLASMKTAGIALLLASTPVAAATSFDMEGSFGTFPGSLTLVDGSLTLTVTPDGLPNGSIFGLPSGVPLLGIGIIAGVNTFGPYVPLRFTFDRDIESITFDFGDAGGDNDGTVLITAFDAGGVTLGTASDTYPAFDAAGRSLTLDFTGARYFIARSSGGDPTRENSLFYQISAASAAGAAVPEASTWAMMVAGFGLMGTMVRRKRTSLAFA